MSPRGLPTRAAALAVGIMIAAAACSNADSAAVRAAPRLTDPAFEEAANSVCEQTVHVFNTASTLPQDATQAQSAALLDTIDQTFAALVQQLRQLVPAPQDRAALDAWLADWDAYVAFGKRYAAAVRVGAERNLIRTESGTEGAVRRRLRAFATANKMPACRFP